MLNVGAGELFAILALALVILGPSRLPDAVRTAGRVYGEVKRITGGFQQELRDTMEDRDAREDRQVPHDDHDGLDDDLDEDWEADVAADAG
jgi:sec-independent protein translocase protein TatB